MICLACAFDNSYGLQQCTNCGQEFRVDPPFIKANHVSQMMTAIDNFQQARIDRASFVRQLDTFQDIYKSIDATWNFTHPLAERMGGTLSTTHTADGVTTADIEQALRNLDSGIEALKAALQRLAAVRNPSQRPASPAEIGLLDKAKALLIDFFRATCSASATLLHVVENSTESSKPVDGLGSLIDIEVS